MSAKIQLNIWHVAKYPGWDWAALGLLEARPGVRSVAKHILMLDLDGRGIRAAAMTTRSTQRIKMVSMTQQT